MVFSFTVAGYTHAKEREMIGKKVIVALVILATALLFSACIVEYDFDRAPAWTSIGGAPISRSDVVGEATGWQGGRLTVTLSLVNGYIENVRIFGERETPSYTRILIQTAERNAALLNSFDFLDDRY